jgi:hypothetical protein
MTQITRNQRSRHTGATWAAMVVAALLLGMLAIGQGASAQAPPSAAQQTSANQDYGAGPQSTACGKGQVHMAVRVPRSSYFVGSSVPFKVQIANVSAHPCSVTALQPLSGLATELVYVRIFDSHGRRVLIPGGPPGLRVRMLPQSLASHQVFSYTCRWSGRVWAQPGAPHSAVLGGMPAPAGRYTAVAILANPALQTGPLHFVLKVH